MLCKFSINKTLLHIQHAAWAVLLTEIGERSDGMNFWYTSRRMFYRRNSFFFCKPSAFEHKALLDITVVIARNGNLCVAIEEVWNCLIAFVSWKHAECPCCISL